MTARFNYVNVILAALLLWAAPSLRAQDGLEGALTRVNPAAPFGWALNRPMIAAADFDGDSKPDGARVVASGGFFGPRFQIELHLSGRPNHEITFESREAALTVAARDLNHDGYPDIVVEQTHTRKRLQVWLNNGQGSFRKGRAEDFPPEGSSRDQLQTCSYRRDHPALFVSPRRGLALVMLTACHISGYPPSSGRFQSLLVAPPASSQATLPVSSRAPPLSQSY